MYDVMEYDGDNNHPNSPEVVLLRSTSGGSGRQLQQTDPSVADAMSRAIVAREHTKATVALADCMVRIKELDVMGDTEKTRITQSGLSDRMRILQEQQSKRFSRMAEVWDVSSKEQAVTQRAATQVKEETKREAVASMERVENVRIQTQAQVSGSRSMALVALASGIIARSVLSYIRIPFVPRRRRGLPWFSILAVLGGGSWAARHWWNPEFLQPQWLLAAVLRRFMRSVLPSSLGNSNSNPAADAGGRREIELTPISQSAGSQAAPDTRQGGRDQ